MGSSSATSPRKITTDLALPTQTYAFFVTLIAQGTPILSLRPQIAE